MRISVHIFRKDVRQLWPLIAVVVAMHALSIWLEVPRPYPVYLFPILLHYLLPLGAIGLVVTAVQNESLCDERQFWLTRPYSRKALMAGKAMFVVASVNLPFFVADVVRLVTQDLPPGPHLLHLLWRQVTLTGWIILGAAALASVTPKLVHFTFSGLALLAAAGSSYRMTEHSAFWGRLDWMRGTCQLAVFSAIATSVLLIQYARRRTGVARGALAVGAAAALLTPLAIPWNAAFALQSRFSGTVSAGQDVQIAFDPEVADDPGVFTGPKGKVVLRVPVRLSGVAKGMEVLFDTARVQLDSSRTGSWDSGWARNVTVNPRAGRLWADVVLDKRLYDRFSDHAVDLRLSFAATLMETSERTYVTQPGNVKLASGDSCMAREWFPLYPTLLCRSEGYHLTLVNAEDPVKGVVTDPVPLIDVQRYGPDPADVGVLPYVSTPGWQFLPWTIRDRFGPESRLVFTTQRPAAHIFRVVPAPNIRLARYKLRNL